MSKDSKLAYQRKWRAANPEKQKIYQERHRKHARNYHLKKYYGMTVEDYDAMFVAQDGLCAVCGEPPRLFRGRLQFDVDHDHETGRVRGLIHHSCNTYMTVFDNKFLFERFMRYKRRKHMTQTRSRIGRVVQYFREVDLDEVRVAFQLVKEVVEGRLKAEGKPTVATRRPRKSKANSPVAATHAHETLADA